MMRKFQSFPRAAAGSAVAALALLCSPVHGQTATPLGQRHYDHFLLDLFKSGGALSIPLLLPGTSRPLEAVRRLDDYMPFLGPSRLRIEQERPAFDRNDLVSLDAFLAKHKKEREDALAKEGKVPPADAEQAAQPQVLPELQLPDLQPPVADNNTRKSAAPAPGTNGAPSLASVTDRSQDNQQAIAQSQAQLTPLPSQLGNAVPAAPQVNPDQILQYFEMRDRAQGNTQPGQPGTVTPVVGVPFVLPNQQQPLIMESGANYRQVDSAGQGQGQ